MTQPGTAGTDDDPLDAIETKELVVNGEVINNLVGLAFDSANASDGVLRFDGTGSTNGITDGSAKVIVGGTVYDVAGGEWVDAQGTSHSLDSWEKIVNSQFDVTITSTTSPVAPGNTLDVTADVTNNGTDSDTQTVTLDINNGVGQVDSANVTLSGGGSTTQTLSWSVPSGQTEQDYQATVASADDSASQIVTVSNQVLFDFETGNTSRWDTDGGLSATSGSPPFNSGSFVGRTSVSSRSSPSASVTPALISGGAEIREFEFYYQEVDPTNTFEGGFRLKNSNGNEELQLENLSPQWAVLHAGGETTIDDGNGAVDEWHRVTATFDWSAGTFDVDWENVETSNQASQTGFSLKQGVDVAEVEITGGTQVQEWDDVRVKK